MQHPRDNVEEKTLEVVLDEERQAAVSWDAETEKRLRWKCDRHVLPCISFLFFLAFLDRTNIGEAASCENDRMGICADIHHKVMRKFRAWSRTFI